MKKSTSLIALLALIVPACQSDLHHQVIDDQDQQLTAYKSESDNLRLERDRIKAEIAELNDQLSFEMDRNGELQNRVEASNAAFQEQSAAMQMQMQSQSPVVEEKSAEVLNLEARLDGSGVEVESRGGFIVLGLPSNLTFGSGKSELNANGQETMNLVSDILFTDYQGMTFWIEGHTDSDQPKKSGYQSNLALSVDRAMSVANYLVFDKGVEPQFVRIAGHGEFSPKGDNESKEGKAANRRVEILVLP